MPTKASALTRTIADGGGNYNSTGTWVEGAVPTSSDDVVATATSGQLTVNVASNAKSINFTGYTNTLTMNATLTVAGNVTLVTGMNISGSSALIVNTTATLTSNTKTWPSALSLTGAVTYTLADAWTVTGTLTLGPSSNFPQTINGFSITAGGSLTNASTGGTSAFVTGTTTLTLNGTGTWSNTGTGPLKNTMTINTAGTITVSGSVYYSTGTLTYTAGTVTTTSSTLNIGGTTTLDVSSITWNNITFNDVGTITLSSNLNASGTMTAGPTSNSALTLNGNTFNIGGSLTLGGTGGSSRAIAGTTAIVLNGTGTWSSSVVVPIQNSLTINTSGTITISGTVYYNTGTLTYSAGTVTTTSSTLNVQGTSTLNTNGINWNNITFNDIGTITLSSNLTATGNVFAGPTSNNVVTLNGNTLNIGGSLTLGGTGGSSRLVTGTTAIVLNGTGTWSASAVTPLRNNLTINTVGTITVSGNVYYNTGTLTYTTGTVITTSSTLNISSATTLDTNGISWGSVTLSGTTTYTMTSSLTVNETLTVSGTTTFSGSGSLILGTTSTWAGSSNMSLGGSLTLGSSMTRTYTGGLTFTATSGTKTITSNGKSFASAITFNGVGGTWQLADMASTSSTVTLTNGTFDLNGKNMFSSTFSSTGAATRVISFGAGVYTLTGTGTVWDVAATLTVTPGTGTIKLTDATSSAKTFSGAGLTYANLWLTGAGTGTFTIAGSNTFADFQVDTPPHTILFTSGTTTTVTTFTVSGTAGNLMTIGSTTPSSFHTLTKSGGGTITSSYLSLSDSHATPSSTWTAGSTSVDGGGNSGWIFSSGSGGISPGTITVTVVVQGGPLSTTDFSLYLNGQGIQSGFTYSRNRGAYTVSETSVPGYVATFSGDCDAQGFIAVVAGGTSVCTLTNTYGAYAPVPASGARPANFGLAEGDVIRAVGDIDLYIVNVFGYKRLFVNPAIFNLYGHLGWDKVKVVSPATRDAFVTSGLFRNCEINSQKVYGLEVASEDVAALHWVNISGSDTVAQDPNFFARVFCINTNEQNLYQMGAEYSSLEQVPLYIR